MMALTEYDGRLADVLLVLCAICLTGCDLASLSHANVTSHGRREALNLASVTSHSRREEKVEELWVDDFDTAIRPQRRDDDDIMQADSPLFSDVIADASRVPDVEEVPVCPPPPKETPEFSCQAKPCESDRECTALGTMCCHNGCQYTCMVPVPPKTYIDWKGEPQRRLASGSSWLVPGQVERPEVDWCSTSDVYYEDEEPLLCPLGHVCHIDDVGDPAKGVPNRGRCVSVKSPAEENRYRIVTNMSNVNCTVGSAEYSNGTTFRYNRHSCDCIEGSVLCKVGRRHS